MKKKLLVILLTLTVTAGTNAQYFQRYFNNVPQRNETFADGLCSAVNYGSSTTANYNIGWGTSYITATADTNNEVRFVRTNRNGTIVNVNVAASFKDNTAAGLWLNTSGNGICEIQRTGNAGGYMGVGVAEDNPITGALVPGTSDGLLTKISNAGAFSNSFRYDFTAGKDVFTAIARSNIDTNRFYVCGYSEKTLYTEVIVMAVRSNGAIIWSNLYHLSNTNYNTNVRAYGIAEVYGGNKVVVVGSYYDATDAALTDGFVLMLNSTGTINWVNRHNLANSTDVYRSVIQTQTPNRIAICGYSNYNPGAAPYNDVWFTSIDTIGNVIGSFKYRHRDVTGAFYPSKGYDLCEFNTVIFVTGPVYTATDTTLGIYRISLNGPLATDEPMQYRSQKYDNAYGIDRTYTGTTWVIRAFTGIDDALLPLTSASYMMGGNILGNTCLYCFTNPTFNLTAPINKPNVIATKVKAGVKTKLAYKKRNYTSTTICSAAAACTLKEDEGQNIGGDDDIIINPNPANNYLDLTLQKDAASIVTIKIIDITGRTMMEKTLNSNELINYRLDISKLNSGVYLVQLNTDSQNVIRRFIKN